MGQSQMSNEERRIAVIAKLSKGTASIAFLALNAYLLYHYGNAYTDGHARGMLLAKQNGNRADKYKKNILRKQIVPE